MKIAPADLHAAVEAGIIAAEQAERLGAFLGERQRDGPRFTLTHVLYYLGGLIAIGAMTTFMTLGWERFGGWGLAAIAVGYALVALRLTHVCLGRGLRLPAGIFGALAVALVPLAIYGVQNGLGLWPERAAYRDYHVWIDWRWLLMELGTLAAGVALLWRYRLPFMVMPIAVTLWYMSMDLVPFLFPEAARDIALRAAVSLWFGLAMLALAFWVDLRSRRTVDYAFWLYLFGALAFWGGLSLLKSESELSRFAYCLINVGMILVGAVLSRRVFAVLGGLGVAGYLGYLAWRVFANSLLFPVVLTAIGLGMVWLGVRWQKHEAAVAARLRGLLPPAVRELIAAREA
jgi:hypothetical protein